MGTFTLPKETAEKLKNLEEVFFATYPKGFEDDELAEAVKRHAGKKRTEFAKEVFSKEGFSDPNEVVKNMAKVVSRSSMVSIFEKKRFNYFSKNASGEQKDLVAIGLEELLHGSFKSGMGIMLEVMSQDNLAKWSLLTIVPYYYAPRKNIFVKPTTTKNILGYFGVEEFKYRPMPSWEFYSKYKKFINELKKMADKRLVSTNAKFTAFLMMSMEIEEADRQILKEDTSDWEED